MFSINAFLFYVLFSTDPTFDARSFDVVTPACIPETTCLFTFCDGMEDPPHEWDACGLQAWADRPYEEDSAPN